MKQVIYNSFKQDKKLKQLERKRTAMTNKRLCYCFTNDEDSKPISNK